MRIDFIVFINNIISIFNELQEPEDLEALQDNRFVQTIDIQAKFMAGHLERIATRAIELNDEQLIGSCRNLGLIKD